MATIKTDFIGAAYQSRSINIDTQECVNLFPEIEQGNSKNVMALIGTPGLDLWSTATNDLACRGLYSSSRGRRFSVNGNVLYEYNSGGVVFNRGTIGTILGMCTFADDGVHLLIADGTYGYQFNLEDDYDSVGGSIVNTAGTLQTISDAGFVGGSHVVFLDGFFLMNQKNSGFFAHTTVRAQPIVELVWDAADVFSAESFPDNIKSIIKISNELWIFGDKSVEVWYNTGDSTSQFQRFRSAVVNFGVAAAHGCSSDGDSVYWIGANNQGQGIIFRNIGYQAERISTHAIEYIIGQMARIDDAVSYCYQQEGHNFFLINFPTSNRTLCYDSVTRLWHERSSYNGTSGINNVFRGISYAMWDGAPYVGDYGDGGIYRMDLDVNTDNGEPIRRIRSTPHIHKDNKNISFNRFELDFERGVGLDGATGGTSDTNTPQGANPQANLQWSDDGGRTWSNDYFASMGKIGEYKKRVQWHRLGMSRDRIFRVTISDPVKVVLIGATMDVEVCDA